MGKFALRAADELDPVDGVELVRHLESRRGGNHLNHVYLLLRSLHSTVLCVHTITTITPSYSL